MNAHSTAQICLKGHMVTTSIQLYPLRQEKFCSQCGSETITKCQNCEADIRGGYYDDEIPSEYYILQGEPDLEPNAYCHNCGEPYPWTKAALDSAKSLIQAEAELDEELKESLVQSLPDIITETPSTNLAISRVRKFIKATGGFSADAIRQFVIDFGCELAVKMLAL